jgi:hypothetical protein
MTVLELAIKEIDRRSIADAHGFGDSFRVDSELILSMEAGIVRFQRIAVPPYEKRYPETKLSG